MLKNKNQAVRQGARRYDKRSVSSICEHWREPRNAEWRPQAQFFNSLLNIRPLSKLTALGNFNLFLPLITNIKGFRVGIAYLPFFYVKKLCCGHQFTQLHIPVIARVKIR